MSSTGTRLAPSWVYAIRRTGALEQCLANGGGGSFVENRAWTRASSLLSEAAQRDERVPIVLAPAEDSSDWRLHFCALIDDIEIDPGDPAFDRRPTTTYRFVGLTRVTPVRPISELRKLSDRKSLSADLIRPYALCKTPAFIGQLFGSQTVEPKRAEREADLLEDDDGSSVVGDGE
jgi:hypothetical protein